MPNVDFLLKIDEQLLGKFDVITEEEGTCINDKILSFISKYVEKYEELYGVIDFLTN